MGPTGEDRSRIYGEDRVWEDGREASSASRNRSRWALAIIGVVLAVGLSAVLIACSNGEATPQTTAESTPQATTETTSQTPAETSPVPENNLLDATNAKLRGVSCTALGKRDPTEFSTLRERTLEGGGIGADILVDEDISEIDVKILGGFILWQVWPKKHFSVLVYNNKEAWEARGLCEQAHEGGPAAKFDEIEGGLICTRATQLEKEHLLLTISRNPSTFQAGSLWVGPDQP